MLPAGRVGRQRGVADAVQRVDLVQVQVRVDEALSDEPATCVDLIAPGQALFGQRGDTDAADADAPSTSAPTQHRVGDHQVVLVSHVASWNRMPPLPARAPQQARIERPATDTKRATSRIRMCFSRPRSPRNLPPPEPQGHEHADH
jgi:hypothetical protein